MPYLLHFSAQIGVIHLFQLAIYRQSVDDNGVPLIKLHFLSGNVLLFYIESTSLAVVAFGMSNGKNEVQARSLDFVFGYLHL